MDILDRHSTNVSQPKFISTQVSDVQYYYLDLRPQPTRDIVVVCGGRERCNADYRIDRRRFSFYSIECVASGSGQLRIRGKDYQLQAGSVFSYGPTTPHSIRNNPKNPMVKYFVDFTGSEAARLLQDPPLHDNMVMLSSPGEVFDIFNDLHRQATRDVLGRDGICATLVRLLILKIHALALPSGAADTRALATYQRCKQQIEESFLAVRSLEEMARVSHVDPAYLCRLFRRFGHQTPYQYLLRLKMNRAAELLLSSGRLIKQVAEDLGFSDPYHFSRVFKSVHRLSPAQFLNRGLRG